MLFDDFFDVKYIFKDDILVISWYWNCVVVLCMNLWCIFGIYYYKFCEIVRDRELKCVYEKVFKNKNVNWKKNVICLEYWFKGK